MGRVENLREYGEYGWWGNFWQLGKLGQVWGKYEKNGEVCWDVGGGKKRYGNMCYGRRGEVCLGCGRWSCGKVWGGEGKVGEVWSVFAVWGGVGKCVWGVLGRGVGNGLG